MKNKYMLSCIYLIGWFYPLSIVVFNIADRFFVIKPSYACPFDFNCDAMMGWVFYGLLLAFVTFLIYFITAIVKFNVPKLFYLTLLNLPALFFLIAFAWNYIYAEVLSFNIILLALSLAVITFSILLFFKAEEKIK